MNGKKRLSTVGPVQSDKCRTAGRQDGRAHYFLGSNVEHDKSSCASSQLMFIRSRICRIVTIVSKGRDDRIS